MSLIPEYANYKDGTIIVTNLKLGGCSPQSRTIRPLLSYSSTSMIDLPANTTTQSPKPPRDASSWSAIKKSGAIKMTPYQRTKSEKRYFVVSVPKYAIDGWWPSCMSNGKLTVGNQYSAVSSVLRSYTSPSASNLPIRTGVSLDTPPDIGKERNTLRSKVVAANVMTYDILTEIAEFKQTAEMIISILRSVTNPLASFARFAESLKRNGKYTPAQISKILEKKWLEVRYGIMPAVYSVRDVLKLAKERNDVYKTDRAGATFKYSIGGPPSTPQKGVYLYTREDVEIKLLAVAKARYDPAVLFSRLFDQIGFNPFLTAWELIPFSFVVDWFANVGEWVLAQSSNITDGALQRSFCESIKETRVKSTYLVADETYSYSAFYPDMNSSHVIGPINVNVEGLLSIETSESYSRNLFTAWDVDLQLDVNLNWKRMLDAWCLGKQPVIDGLRNLKRVF